MDGTVNKYIIYLNTHFVCLCVSIGLSNVDTKTHKQHVLYMCNREAKGGT